MNDWKSLIGTFIFRDLMSNWIRSGLTIIGIALGVSVMLAISLANDAALSKFRDGVDLVAGKANFQIRSRLGMPFDERALADLSAFRSEVKMTPVIEQFALVPGENREIVQVLGLDMLADRAFRSVSLSGANSPAYDFEIFKEGRIYVGTKLAQKYNLKVGSELKLLAADREKSFKVAGIIGEEGAGKVFGGNVAFMDIGSAQAAFEMPGRIDHIDLIVPEEIAKLTEPVLANELPSDLVLDRPARRTEQVQKMVAAFQYNLYALSLIALLVGMFLIYNTMSVSVIRKRPEIGTMRVLGVSKSQIFFLFACQAVLLGALGSALGVLGGLLFSKAAINAVGRTVVALYAEQPPIDVQANPAILWTAFFIGLGATLLAALGPVAEAFSVSAAEASRRASYELRILSNSGTLTALGIVLILLAIAAAFAPPINGFPVFGYVSAALVVFGAALELPRLLQYLLRLLEPPVRAIFGTEGQLSMRSLIGSIGRSSVTVASLMTGIAMMVSLAIMIGSFRETVIVWVNQTFKADIYIKSLALGAGKLRDDTVSRISKTPGVLAVDAFVEFPVDYQGRKALLGSGDLDVLWKYGNLKFIGGVDGKQVLETVAAGDGCIVSESFASRFGTKVGDVVQLPSPKGVFQVPVEGIYYDYVSDLGYIVITRSLYEQYFGKFDAMQLGVYLKPDVDVDKARTEIINQLPSDVRLSVRTNKELKVEILRIFDNTFAITYALHAIAITVALLGIMNSLFAMVLEMRRELAILKYVGTSDSQLRRMVVIEAATLGVFGSLTGLIVGFALSFLLIHVINKQSFGWTIQVSLPIDFLLSSFALVFICSIIAGLVPARYATRTLDLEAIRAE